jgi:hypothetical protein
VPGRIWDAPNAFPEYSEAGTEVPFFFPTGTMHLKSKAMESKDVSNDKKLSFVSWKAKGLLRRTENCEGNATLGSQGLDCSSPLGTISKPVPLGPGMPALPAYLSWILFEKHFMEAGDFIMMHEGQKEVPYDPADRTTITRCAGNAWCDDDANLDFLLKTEPETGFLFGANVHFMLSLRIGTRPTLLHNFNDTLVPIAGLHVGAMASDKQQELLADLQILPRNLTFFMLVLIGFCAFGVVALISCVPSCIELRCIKSCMWKQQSALQDQVEVLQVKP